MVFKLIPLRIAAHQQSFLLGGFSHVPIPLSGYHFSFSNQMKSLLTAFFTSITHILPFCLVFILTGLILIYVKQYRKGTFFGLSGFFMLYLFSLFPIAWLLLHPLQTQYTQYTANHSPIQYVVVLGGYHKSNKHIPISNQLSTDSLTRIVEAIIIYRNNPGSKLLLSGGAPENDAITNAQMMALLAQKLGVPESAIILETRASNTEEEAYYLQETLRDFPFILVTSAAHMARAMGLFRKRNLHPQPAPVNFLFLQKIHFSLVPSPIALQNSDKALHEYIGSLWKWIKS